MAIRRGSGGAGEEIWGSAFVEIIVYARRDERIGVTVEEV